VNVCENSDVIMEMRFCVHTIITISCVEKIIKTTRRNNKTITIINYKPASHRSAVGLNTYIVIMSSTGRRRLGANVTMMSFSP